MKLHEIPEVKAIVDEWDCKRPAEWDGWLNPNWFLLVASRDIKWHEIEEGNIKPVTIRKGDFYVFALGKSPRGDTLYTRATARKITSGLPPGHWYYRTPYFRQLLEKPD